MNAENLSVFPAGKQNDAYEEYFTGQSYLAMLSTEQVVIGNVTFEPGCRNHWHIHHADKGGGQILLAVSYTHLDVYKRQTYDTAAAQAGGGRAGHWPD